jgi:hypothetical protein
VPTAQAIHALSPATALNVPTEHGLQGKFEVTPELVLYQPVGQTSHTKAPLAEKLPLLQLKHVVAPLVPEY